MRKNECQTALPSKADDNEHQLQTRREFLAAQPPPLPETGFINERAVLSRVPVSRRTWGSWKARGLIPSSKSGDVVYTIGITSPMRCVEWNEEARPDEIPKGNRCGCCSRNRA